MNMRSPGLTPVSCAAKASLRRLSASVAVASGLAASGRCIDLIGLEEIAGLLCAQVLDLEPAESVAFRPAIITLNDNIASLMTALTITRE